MADPTIQGVIGTLGALAKGVQTLKELATAVEVKAGVIDLYDLVLAGQQAALEDHLKQRALLDKISDLEKELASVKAWEKQKERYALVNPWSDAAVVYALKASHKETEKPHWICTKCYDDGVRSILQLKTVGVEHNHYACPNCKTEIKVRGTRPRPRVDLGPGPRY